jgi:hypothetical protein
MQGKCAAIERAVEENNGDEVIPHLGLDMMLASWSYFSQSGPFLPFLSRWHT